MGKVKRDISESKWRDVGLNQQRMMMRYNNLALMLEESLQQMQEQQQKSNKPGDGSCNKPGGKGKPQDGSGQPNLQQLKEMLKEQISEMKGDKPGGKKQGESGSPMPIPGGKELMEMLQGNEQLSKEIRKLKQELNKDGSGKGN